MDWFLYDTDVRHEKVNTSKFPNSSNPYALKVECSKLDICHQFGKKKPKFEQKEMDSKQVMFLMFLNRIVWSHL